jgi:catalase
MNIPQRTPMMRFDEGRLTWFWKDGEGDWGYPLSTDGHVFETEELKNMVSTVEFTSPNTLEAALQSFAPTFRHRQGFCYAAARVMNIPWNITQTDHENRHEDGTIEDMLRYWQAGKQIKLESYYWMNPQACHEPCELVLEVRR